MKKNKSFLVASIAPLFLYSNCQVKETLVVDEKNAIIKSLPDLSYIDLKDNAPSPDKSHVIAKLHKSSCSTKETDRSSLLLEIPFKSAWDESTAVFHINISEKRIYVLIGQTKLFIPLTDVLPAQTFAQEVCATEGKEPNQFILQNPISIAFVGSLLESLATGCRFSLSEETGGWFCHIDTLDAGVIEKKLDEIQRRMVRKWQRQPYLLARKIAMGIDLATVIRSAEPNDKIKNFCAITANSLLQELPSVLQAEPLRKKLCESTDDTLKMRASLLLTEIYKEINMLAEKFENQSPLGTLIVRLPQERSMTSELWINLKLASPEKTPSAMIAAPFDDKQGVDLCWHPIYENDFHAFAGAIEMTLLSPGNRHCVRLLTEGFERDLTEARSSIAYSISSEMEFTVTNGRGIVLRLPQGDYEYTIQSYPGKLSEWPATEKATARAQGLISWKGQHPVATIHQ